MTYPRPHSELEVDKNPGLLILVSSVPLQAKGFKIEEGSMVQGPGIPTQNYFCVFMCAKRPGAWLDLVGVVTGSHVRGSGSAWPLWLRVPIHRAMLCSKNSTFPSADQEEHQMPGT